MKQFFSELDNIIESGLFGKDNGMSKLVNDFIEEVKTHSAPSSSQLEKNKTQIKNNLKRESLKSSKELEEMYSELEPKNKETMKNEYEKGKQFLELIDEQHNIQWGIVTKLSSLIKSEWNSIELQKDLENLIEKHSKITKDLNSLDDNSLL